MMLLFDEIDAHKILTSSRYKNSVVYTLYKNREDFSEIIAQIETWFSRIPDHRASNLKSRFLNRDNRQHWGAFWELAISEYFRLKTDQVIWGSEDEGEPDLFVRKSKNTYAIEVTSLLESDEEIKQNDLLERLTDKINGALKAPFRLAIQCSDKLPYNINFNEIISQIGCWIKESSLRRPEKISRLRIKVENAHIDIWPMVSQGDETVGLLPIYAAPHSDRVEYVKKIFSVRKREQLKRFRVALRSKGIPLLVALGNSTFHSINRHTVEWALVGSPTIIVRKNQDTGEITTDDKLHRDNRGIMVRSEYFKSRHKRWLSGVLYFEKHIVNSIYEISARLFVNGFADLKIDDFDLKCPTFKPVIESSEGVKYQWINEIRVSGGIGIY